MHNTAVFCMLMDVLFDQTRGRTDRPTIYERQAMFCVWKLNVQSVILANGAGTRGAHCDIIKVETSISCVCVCVVFCLHLVVYQICCCCDYRRLFLSNHVTF